MPPPGVQAARPEAPEAVLLNKQQLKKIHKPHVPSVPPIKNAIKWVPKKIAYLFIDSFILELGHVQRFVVWISVPGKLCWVSSLPLGKTDISLAPPQRTWYVNS